MTYAGLCIGGPLNSQHYTNTRDSFRAPMAPADPTQRIEMAMAYADPKPVQYFVYHHFNLTAFGIADRDPSDYTFWVDANIPEDRRSIHVMTALMQGYRSI